MSSALLLANLPLQQASRKSSPPPGLIVLGLSARHDDAEQAAGAEAIARIKFDDLFERAAALLDPAEPHAAIAPRQQRLQIEARRLLEAGERRVPRPHQMPVRRDIEAAGYMHDDAGRLPKRLGLSAAI
jgi:hypothetical protein